MKKTFTLLTAVLGLTTLSFGQVGSQAQDFTVTDLDGHTHTLSTILGEGKVVILDCSATWCSPCWGFHEGGFLQDLHDLYGPNGTDQVRVIYYEADASTTLADLQGTGGNTQGDWLTGHTFPFVDETTLSLSGANYWPLGFPTINVIDPATGIIQADLFDPWSSGGGLAEMVDIIDDYWGAASTNEVNELTSTKFTVYPNPATSSTTMSVNLEATANVTVEVYNLVGALVSTEVYNGVEGSNEFTVNTSALENGQYILSVSLGDVVAQTRVSLNVLR